MTWPSQQVHPTAITLLALHLISQRSPIILILILTSRYTFRQLVRHTDIQVLYFRSTIFNMRYPPRIYRHEVVRSKFEQQIA